MKFSLSLIAASFSAALALPAALSKGQSSLEARNHHKYAPKVMIVSMFAPEREVWIEPLGLHNNISTPGLSPLFPDIACNDEYTICIVTTGEAESNAGPTSMAMVLSPHFDLRKTYFFLAGIAGINPACGTLGTAAYARFAVQVGLAYELDARQKPEDWPTGYWALGTKKPGELPDPKDLYGTEVYELNTNLLDRVYDLAKNAKLNDSTTAQTYRSYFPDAPANQPPVVTRGDGITSDVYFAGTLLAEAFGNYTSLMTKGQGSYCTTAQEDVATLQSLVRGAKAGLVDYDRVILLRTASDFDRAPNNSVNAYDAFEADQGGFEPAVQNLYLAGWPVIKEIVYDWPAWAESTPSQSKGNGSFYGDDFGTLRGGIDTAQARRRSKRRVLADK